MTMSLPSGVRVVCSAATVSPAAEQTDLDDAIAESLTSITQ